VAAPDDDRVPRLRCVAFKPTGRFRDRVRSLPGDRVTVCGEHEVRLIGDSGGAEDDGNDGPDSGQSTATLKLEKFAVRDLVETEPAVPTCPDCGRSMSSAGRGGATAASAERNGRTGKVEESIDRELEPGWYEVPPSARRHVAKPLVRGGFDGPIHPER